MDYCNVLYIGLPLKNIQKSENLAGCKMQQLRQLCVFLIKRTLYLCCVSYISYQFVSGSNLRCRCWPLKPYMGSSYLRDHLFVISLLTSPRIPQSFWLCRSAGGRGWFCMGKHTHAQFQLHKQRASHLYKWSIHMFTCCLYKWGCTHMLTHHFCSLVPNNSRPNNGLWGWGPLSHQVQENGCNMGSII